MTASTSGSKNTPKASASKQTPASARAATPAGADATLDAATGTGEVAPPAPNTTSSAAVARFKPRAAARPRAAENAPRPDAERDKAPNDLPGDRFLDREMSWLQFNERVLQLSTDPNVPLEGKVSTVQGGETAPELFETMAASQAESGAQFQVVNPVLPGYTPDSVLASVNFTLPDQPAQPAENVEFIFENGEWKLSQSWACTLITNTVAPDQVPAMCQEFAPAPAPAEEAPAEAPADAPAPAPAS